MQCGEFVGEYGEEEIYESFVGGKSLFIFMCSKGKILEIVQSNLRSQLLCGFGGQSVKVMI